MKSSQPTPGEAQKATFCLLEGQKVAAKMARFLRSSVPVRALIQVCAQVNYDARSPGAMPGNDH